MIGETPGYYRIGEQLGHGGTEKCGNRGLIHCSAEPSFSFTTTQNEPEFGKGGTGL